MGAGQTFTIRNTGGGTQYDIYVSGPRGVISGQRVAADQLNYSIPMTGDYYIYVESSTTYNSIEFCAY